MNDSLIKITDNIIINIEYFKALYLYKYDNNQYYFKIKYTDDITYPYEFILNINDKELKEVLINATNDLNLRKKNNNQQFINILYGIYDCNKVLYLNNITEIKNKISNNYIQLIDSNNKKQCYNVVNIISSNDIFINLCKMLNKKYNNKYICLDDNIFIKNYILSIEKKNNYLYVNYKNYFDNDEKIRLYNLPPKSYIIKCYSDKSLKISYKLVKIKI